MKVNFSHDFVSWTYQIGRVGKPRLDRFIFITCSFESKLALFCIHVWEPVYPSGASSWIVYLFIYFVGGGGWSDILLLLLDISFVNRGFASSKSSGAVSARGKWIQFFVLKVYVFVPRNEIPVKTQNILGWVRCFGYGKRRMTGKGSVWQCGIDLLQPTHLQNMLLADRGLKPSEKTPPATSKVMNFHKTRINVYKYLRSRYRKLDIIKFSLRIHYSFHTHTQLEFYNKILSWLRHVKACIQQMSILQ